PIAQAHNVSLYPLRGFNGKSHAHEEVLPFLEAALGRFDEVVVLYLGDFDKKGFEIEADARRKFASWGAEPSWVRLAITEEVINAQHLQRDEEGKVELEALDPPVLRAIVTDAIESCIDATRLDEL